MAYCENCRYELSSQAPLCPKCGHPQPAGQIPNPSSPMGQVSGAFCRSCGAQVSAQAVMCMNCGAPVGAQMAWQQGAGPNTGKSKTTAVLLAVFLSFWTWLYTFKRDSTKFWIGLGAGIGGFVLRIVLEASSTVALNIIGALAFFACSLGVWIWAIVDASTKPSEYYAAMS